MAKAHPENVKSRDYMKGLIALATHDAFRLKSLQDIKELLLLLSQDKCMLKKKMSSATKLLLQTVMPSAVFVNADNSSWIYLELPCSLLRKAEVRRWKSPELCRNR